MSFSKSIFKLIDLSQPIVKNNENAPGPELGFRISLTGLLHFIVNYHTK